MDPFIMTMGSRRTSFIESKNINQRIPFLCLLYEMCCSIKCYETEKKTCSRNEPRKGFGSCVWATHTYNKRTNHAL